MKLQPQQRGTLEIAGLGILFIACAAIIKPGYKLLYNPTESAPIGWYVVKPVRRIQVGEYVLARLPAGPETLASDRGYLPPSVPILKHIAATSGQEVCRQGDQITIDGILITHALEHDGVGRQMPRWKGCQTLAPDEVFLLSTDSSLSYDSRYFGPLPMTAILGEALPLWTH